MRLSKYHRLWIYAVGGTLVASGTGWLIAHYLLIEPGPFAEAQHPSEPWWLRLHGAAMMVFLVVLGTILPGHVRQAWSLRKINAASVKRNVTTGILMLSLVTGLGVTGYALYYCGSEELPLPQYLPLGDGTRRNARLLPAPQKSRSEAEHH